MCEGTLQTGVRGHVSCVDLIPGPFLPWLQPDVCKPHPQGQTSLKGVPVQALAASCRPQRPPAPGPRWGLREPLDGRAQLPERASWAFPAFPPTVPTRILLPKLPSLPGAFRDPVRSRVAPGPPRVPILGTPHESLQAVHFVSPSPLRAAGLGPLPGELHVGTTHVHLPKLRSCCSAEVGALFRSLSREC